MRTAIYIEDGVVQLVLTPETDFEKNALGSFAEKPTSTKIMQGSFYDCRGGWTRQNHFHPSLHGVPMNEDRSLILRIETERE